MSRHRARTVRPIRPVTVVNAVLASAIIGAVLPIIKPLGPLFAYFLGI